MSHTLCAQELLNHNDIKAAIICAHVLNRGLSGMVNPLDGRQGEDQGCCAGMYNNTQHAFG